MDKIIKDQKLSMKSLEIDRDPLIGEFNTNYFLQHGDDLALLRVPKRNPDLLENIIHEYRAIGFTGQGGRVKRRSGAEQYEFGWKAAQAGLLVLPPLALNGENVEYPFLTEAQTLDVYFNSHQSDLNGIVFQLVRDLKRTHSKGFVYGDRWSGNMLVDPKFGLVHIDFDLEISGPTVRELDVAQVIYHTLWAGKEQVLPILANLFGKEDRWFDNDIVTKYLRGLAKYFNKTKVGGLENMIEDFIETMQAVKSKI